MERPPIEHKNEIIDILTKEENVDFSAKYVHTPEAKKSILFDFLEKVFFVISLLSGISCMIVIALGDKIAIYHPLVKILLLSTVIGYFLTEFSSRTARKYAVKVANMIDKDLAMIRKAKSETNNNQ